jgi:nucleotide-binding universal stress UspA family protein
MPFRDILVHLDTSPQSEQRLQVAAALAARQGQYLIGLHAAEVMTPAGVISASGKGTDLYDVSYAAWERQVAEADAALKARFAAVVSAHGLTGEFRAAKGPVADTVGSHARFADLTMIGQTPEATANMGTVAWLVEHVLLTSGRPVMVLPVESSPAQLEKFDHILVGWDGSRAAVRAVHDALPLLKRAVKVTVLSVTAEHGGSGKVALNPGSDVAPHLARHGIAVEATTVPQGKVSAGATLLEQVTSLGANLLVTGGYGHSRLREFVLGGATRYILLNATVPVLLSH